MEMESDKIHRHRHKKHKKHKKHHRRSNRESSEVGDGGSTEQDVELDQIEYSMGDVGDVIEETVTIGNEEHFLMDEHCEGALEVIEELVEIDENEIGTINIEEMVLENYGQDYEELDVDVDGMDEEALDIDDDDLIGDIGSDEEETEEEDQEEEEDEDENDEEEDESLSTPEKQEKPKPIEGAPKGNGNIRLRLGKDRTPKKTKDDGDASSEEEAWLKALEAGKLEEVDDELKKIKNPKLMTVRQRALLERKGELQTEENIKEELVALDFGYKETIMTAELIKKKESKAQKRREEAAKKREKEKKRTIDRLLQKKESKLNKSSASSSATSSATAPLAPIARYTWKQTLNCGTTFSVPPGASFPLEPQKANDVPAVTLCAVKGCGQTKRYSCSKTFLPLCSLQCYRTNLESLTRTT